LIKEMEFKSLETVITKALLVVLEKAFGKENE
jgi:hypothetical protein